MIRLTVQTQGIQFYARYFRNLVHSKKHFIELWKREEDIPGRLVCLLCDQTCEGFSSYVSNELARENMTWCTEGPAEYDLVDFSLSE